MHLLLAVRDPTWWNQHQGAVTLASLIVAAIAILIAIGIFFYQREPKTFDYEICTDERIVGRAAGKAPGGLQIYWAGEELTSPRIITIRLMNTGKREIRPNDFDGNIRISVPGAVCKSTAVLNARKGMRHLPVPLDGLTAPDTCDVTPILYNRGDWVDLQLFVDGPVGEHGKPTVDAAIAGASRQTKQRSFLGITLKQRFSMPDRSVVPLVAIMGVGTLVMLIIAFTIQYVRSLF